MIDDYRQKAFGAAVNTFFKISSASKVMFKKGAVLKKGLICKKYHGLTACFGAEGDKDAPIAFIDGSYLLRDRGGALITFGFCPEDIDGKIKWYNSEGWLPCFVSEFCSRGAHFKIENFADRKDINGKKFVIAYTRMTVKNDSGVRLQLPKKPHLLIPLNNQSERSFVEPGETLVLDFAVGADRYGGLYPYPANDKIAALGGFDEHYNEMKEYWTRRVEPLVEIRELPDMRLADAYKAGYVYTQIVKDGDELHVGENGYDRVFDHDVIGILAMLITIGDFRHFKEYVRYILKNVQYPDAQWKYSWVFALYLLKTDDEKYIREKFGEIRENTHKIAEDRINGGSGIMKRTMAIDSNGYWMIDNWSALTGLASYAYICSRLDERAEERWAKEQYDSLLKECNRVMSETLEKYSISYIPVSMFEPNGMGQRKDPRDANWASMFLFGRWAWDAYILGAPQYGPMLDLIDETYAHGFETRRDITENRYNFGGFPHGYYSSSYNAGYGSAALRGKRYRDAGIKAYQFMLDNTQSGPFAWWEGIGYPDESSPWDIPHAAGGGGSCQHIWGQSVAIKVLFDSLISEKTDRTLIIGRGIPDEWKTADNAVEVRNYPVSGGRVSFRIQFLSGCAELTISGCEGFTVLPQFGYEGRVTVKVAEFI